MNRLLALIFFLSRGEMYNAEKVCFNYYGKKELYKGEISKTLNLVSRAIEGRYTTLEDVERSVNVIRQNEDKTGYTHSKFECRNASIGQQSFWEDYNFRIAQAHPVIAKLHLTYGVRADFGDF